MARYGAPLAIARKTGDASSTKGRKGREGSRRTDRKGFKVDKYDGVVATCSLTATWCGALSSSWEREQAWLEQKTTEHRATLKECRGDTRCEMTLQDRIELTSRHNSSFAAWVA